MREIPSGAIGVGEASATVVVASALFIGASYALNGVCFLLSPIALAWVLFYSYTKRFTRASHLVLGIGLSIAPVGGYLAITGRWSHPRWMLGALAIAVASWSAGFDILYALQDIEFDQANSLHSIPVALGERRALVVARLLHVVSVSSLVAVGIAVGAGVLYGAGVAIVAALLLYEHTLVKPGDLSKLDAAFFTMNGIISLVYFGFVVAERVVR
jgi:4-hydroxybenzoate polyprenyltransferase